MAKGYGGGHASKVKGVIGHAGKHGTTAHHDKSGVHHGFPSFGHAATGGGAKKQKGSPNPMATNDKLGTNPKD